MNYLTFDPYREFHTLQHRHLGGTPARRERDEELSLGAWIPPVDIEEDNEKLVLTAELPGFKEDQIDIQVEGGVLTIRYTGSIYQGFRDPSPVFAAISLLPDTLRNRIIVEFFGDASNHVLALAAKHRVNDRVAARPPVPYRRALELQMTADILLLLQWSDKRDEGTLPVKIFEYLYARRPILFIGYEQGIAARLIRERGAGLVSNTPERIRDQLQAWIKDKQAGRLSQLDPSVSRGLSRDDQFRRLEHIFAKVLNQRHGATEN